MQAQLFQLATFISSEIIEWPRDTQILASGCAQCQEKWEKEEINVKVKTRFRILPNLWRMLLVPHVHQLPFCTLYSNTIINARCGESRTNM